MQQLAKLFWEICLLRKGPQHVPAAPLLFWLLFLLGVVMDLVMASTVFGWQDTVEVVLVNTATLFGVVGLLMASLGYARRIIQTLSTLIGTGLVFSLLHLPLIILVRAVPELAETVALVEVSLLIWGLLVIAHILRHALSIELLLAGVLAFGYFLLSYQLINYLIPQAA